MSQQLVEQLRTWGQDPNVRHFLDVVIPGAEGTTTHGYNTAFGGDRFDSLADHPRYLKPFKQTDGKTNYTSAAGKYQFLSNTWDETAKALGLSDFGPENQDLGALYLLHQRGVLPDLQRGDFKTAVNKTGSVWASLPSSNYPQPKRDAGFIEGLVNQMIPAAQAGTMPQQSRATPPAAAPIQGNMTMNPQAPSALPNARGAYNPEDPMSVYQFIVSNQQNVQTPQLSPEQQQALTAGRQQRASMLPLAIGASLAGDKRVSGMGQALYKDSMEATGSQRLGDQGWMTQDGQLIKSPFAEEQEQQKRQDVALQLALGTANTQALRRLQTENSFTQSGFTPDGRQIVTNRTGQNYVIDQSPNGVSYMPHSGPVIPKATFDKNVQDAQILNASAARSDAILNQVNQNPDAFGIVASGVAKLPQFAQGRAAELVLSPQAMDVRTNVLRQAAQEISDLYGAALSMGEQARANTFIPNSDDPPSVVISKLKSARDWASSKASVYGPAVNQQAGARTGQTQAPNAPQQEERKELGGKTYVKRNGQWFEE
jgi:muramidase (phage lysozyme)